MKKIMVCLFFVFTNFTLSLNAQILWDKAEYGMTLERVKELYPKALTVTKENSADDGSKELLNIKEIKISKDSFNVGFFFKDNKLTRVYFLPNAKLNDKTGDRVFKTLVEYLIGIYGQPDSTNTENVSIMITKSAKWKSDGINIFLSSMIIGKNNTIYLLYYKEQ